jgi:hypothetical protein
MRAGDAAQGAAVGQMEQLLHGVDQSLEAAQPLAFVFGEVGLLGQALRRAQGLEYVAELRLAAQEILVQVPEMGVGAVEEAQLEVGPEDRDRAAQVLEHGIVGVDVAP